MTVKRVAHRQRCTHLATSAEDADANYRSSPASLVVQAETCHHCAQERDTCRNGASWQTHLGFTDAVIALGVEVGYAIGEGTAEVRPD